MVLAVACRKDVDPPVPICVYPVDADFDGYASGEGGGGDCDDSNNGINPGLSDAEVDGVDQNCDGVDGPPVACESTGPESCDGLDNDCDGRIDDTLLVALSVGATVALVAPLGEDLAPLLVLGKTVTGTDPGKVSFYDMTGEEVLEISGGDLGPTFGQQLASGRDYNGDGIPDLAVSAPYATTAAGPNHGRVLVLPGPITSTTTLDDAIFVFDGGELDGQAGAALGLAPDLTGDGKAELLVGHYRHLLLFSGATGVQTKAGAKAIIELNTGGGAWHFATMPDEDGDAYDGLALGMSTYNSGAGLVMRLDSSVLQKGDGTYAVPDSSWHLDGDAGAAIGDKLTRVGDHLWWLSNGIPQRDDGQHLDALTGISLFNLGDLDDDGAEDLGVETTDTLEVQTAVPQTLTGYAGFQGTRDLGPLRDVDGDGRPELVFRTQSQSGVLDLIATLQSICNQDHDLSSSAMGDCDDTNAMATPMVGREVEDGVDNDCDGLVDNQLERLIQGHFVLSSGLGNDGLVLLDQNGVASVYGGADCALQGSVEGGLASGPAQLVGVGDPDGDGTNAFFLVTDMETILYRSDLTIQSEVVDGSRFVRAAQAGTAGDVDGDGLTDPWVLMRNQKGELALGIWHTPAEVTVTDDADSIMILPNSWLSTVVGAASPGSQADLSGDGRDDLVFGNPDAWDDFGGRASVVPVINDGEHLMDSEAVLALYGDPNENLGRSITLGDFNGDGTADSAIGGLRGARIVTGMDCTRPGPYPIPTDSLALVDLDGDGVDELLGTDLNATVLGNGDAGAVWIGRYGEDPYLWRAGNAADLLGIQLFAMPRGVGVRAQEEVRLWGATCEG